MGLRNASTSDQGAAEAGLDAVAEATRAVVEARRLLDHWHKQKEGALAEIARLQETSGERILDDPQEAAQIPKRIREQRDLIDVADSALSAQADRVRAAESEWLSAQADAMEKPVGALRARLAAHNAKTEKLLAALRAHDGPYVPEVWLLKERAGREDIIYQDEQGNRIVLEWQPSTGDTIQMEIDQLEVPIGVLRRLAAGEDPAGTVEYPSCVWGPDALVPAPQYVRLTAQQEGARQQALAALSVVEAQVADLEAKIAAGVPGPTGFQSGSLSRPPTWQAQLEQRRRVRDELASRATEYAS